MTREEAIVQLKMDRDLCNFNPMTGEKEPMNEDCRKSVEALDMAINALEQEPCEDAVSRKAVVEYIKASDAELGHDCEKEIVVGDILTMPSVKPVACIAKVKFSKEDMQELVNEKMKEIVVERKKGKWVDIHDRDEWYGDQYRCSLCGKVTIDNGLYCPNCGAEMENKE